MIITEKFRPGVIETKEPTGFFISSDSIILPLVLLLISFEGELGELILLNRGYRNYVPMCLDVITV